MSRIVIIAIIILISIFISIGLIQQIGKALQAGNRLDQAVEEVSQLQQKKRNLENQLKSVKEYDFLEQVARDKLNLAKDGETVVIIPEQEIQEVINMQKEPEKVEQPYYQGWLRLFFY